MKGYSDSLKSANEYQLALTSYNEANVIADAIKKLLESIERFKHKNEFLIIAQNVESLLTVSKAQSQLHEI